MNTPRRSLGSIVAPLVVGATSAVTAVGLYDVAGEYDRRGDLKTYASQIDPARMLGEVDQVYARFAVASIGAVAGFISTVTCQLFRRQILEESC